MQQPRGLQVINVDKVYPTRSGNLQALARISLTVPPGEFVCAIGPSGCGKTSLLYILAGLETPTSGQVLVDGQPVAGTEPSRVLLFQEAALFPWLTVEDNIVFGLKMNGTPGDRRRATTAGASGPARATCRRNDWPAAATIAPWRESPTSCGD